MVERLEDLWLLSKLQQERKAKQQLQQQEGLKHTQQQEREDLKRPQNSVADSSKSADTPHAHGRSQTCHSSSSDTTLSQSKDLHKAGVDSVCCTLANSTTAAAVGDWSSSADASVQVLVPAAGDQGASSSANSGCRQSLIASATGTGSGSTGSGSTGSGSTGPGSLPGAGRGTCTGAAVAGKDEHKLAEQLTAQRHAHCVYSDLYELD